MSAIPSAQAPSSHEAHAAATTPSAPPASRRNRFRPGRLLALAVVVGLIAVGMPTVMSWVNYRRTHSITDDAFVEAHIVNVAPQLVSGRIIRFLADENDRVAQGQVVAEIDPIPYRDKVNVARAQLDSALAELNRQRADLDRVRKEVPIQIEIARRTSAAAVSDRVKAEKSLTLTADDVDKGIDEARAGVKAARASLTLAELEYTRFTRLEREGASPPRQRDQVTQSRDSASAQVDLAEARLAKALASRTQIDVARSALEAAQKSEQKAAKGINLAEIGYDQIREIELLVKVKEQSVQQARRALEAAENDLAYTRVRAPFPGVVVKRYRNLGDFASAGSPLLSMFDPDLLYVEANLEEDRLPGVEPGNPVRIALDAFAEPFRGRVVWVNKSNRGPVRPDAPERRFGRVHARGAAGAGADPDRARRPLAAASRRALGERGHRAWPRRCRLGRGGGAGDGRARDAI